MEIKHLQLYLLVCVIFLTNCKNEKMTDFNPELEAYCKSIIAEFDQIDSSRKLQLESLGNYILEKQKDSQVCNLTFICTHNSRRSHFGQIWAQTAAYWYGIPNIRTFSGGTEASAFHKNAVGSVIRAGFTVENQGSANDINPVYLVKQGDTFEFMRMSSKVYNDLRNPFENFAAVMVCSDADENCPFIPGGEKRFSITYDDPKEFDGTPNEALKYDERCAQIAREMFYVFDYVTTKEKRSC